MYLRQIRPNFCKVVDGDLTVWFSYETPISFYNSRTGEQCTRVNDWGPTTGKHLNAISEKEGRVDGLTFTQRLEGQVR